MSDSLVRLKLDPDLQFTMRDVVNRLYLLAQTIPTKEASEEFNALARQPLEMLKKRFTHPDAVVHKIARPYRIGATESVSIDNKP